MTTYSITKLAELTDRNSSTLEEWFDRMEYMGVHFTKQENGKRTFSNNDLYIVRFIIEKRDEKLAFGEIFEMLKNNPASSSFSPEEIPPTQGNHATIDSSSDPEALFHNIAQENDVIKIFKYHSLRVMFLSGTLAKRVGCYDDDLRLATLHHDIGKMGISKDILLKPTKLNELEYTIIKSHPHIGNLIAREQLGLPRVAHFIRDHHERWDGKDYPRGLTGDFISIQGRIIAISDAFDTMTVDRKVYNNQPVLSYDKALIELQRCAWSQFDGDLVHSFVEMIQGGTKVPSYMVDEL